jgi:hypothetical protein
VLQNGGGLSIIVSRKSLRRRANQQVDNVINNMLGQIVQVRNEHLNLIDDNIISDNTVDSNSSAQRKIENAQLGGEESSEEDDNITIGSPSSHSGVSLLDASETGSSDDGNVLYEPIVRIRNIFDNSGGTFEYTKQNVMIKEQSIIPIRNNLKKYEKSCFFISLTLCLKSPTKEEEKAMEIEFSNFLKIYPNWKLNYKKYGRGICKLNSKVSMSDIEKIDERMMVDKLCLRIYTLDRKILFTSKCLIKDKTKYVSFFFFPIIFVQFEMYQNFWRIKNYIVKFATKSYL